MTHIDRILHHILHDPWAARIFLAFTVGMFLSCSAEFASGQESAVGEARSAATWSVSVPLDRCIARLPH